MNNDIRFKRRNQHDHSPVEIRIAKPIEDLEEELIDRIWEIAFSLAGCTLIIILLSYKLVGKILTPVADITRMANVPTDSIKVSIFLSLKS